MAQQQRYQGFTGRRIVVGISENSDAGQWTLTGRRVGSSVGQLSINVTEVNATANQVFVMAAEAPVTAYQVSGGSRTIYLATLPV
ncbi:MAG: hypothetical protein MZV65_39425 [Chromatiales bacterium]|nr:hypothetical protein [Chromatiales bacterium]